MNMITDKKLKIVTGLIVCILLAVSYGIFTAKKIDTQNQVVTTDETQDKPHSEDFSKYACEFTSNVGWTECTIEALDRASAEREWKQRKLEVIKNPQVNEENMTPELVDEQNKILKWRKNFETGRDSWCEARLSFRAGSGTPGGIADCALEFEIRAIKDLNFLHYDIIRKDYEGTGISNFEPTNSDINALIKTNKTSRGCVWAGEETCD